MANGGLVKELQELQPAPGVTLPPRDVRARRPFLLRALIKLSTLRAIARVLALGFLDAAGVFPAPVVTEIVPFVEFFPAEAYHQNYYADHGRQPYCRAVSQPKVEKLRDVFRGRLKSD